MSNNLKSSIETSSGLLAPYIIRHCESAFDAKMLIHKYCNTSTCIVNCNKNASNQSVF